MDLNRLLFDHFMIVLCGRYMECWSAKVEEMLKFEFLKCEESDV